MSTISFIQRLKAKLVKLFGIEIDMDISVEVMLKIVGDQAIIAWQARKI